MKASLFCTARYMGAAPHDIWPLSGGYISCDAAVQSMQTTFDQFPRADEFGFDWVTLPSTIIRASHSPQTRWSWRAR
jgi:hypothetical protein